ncbi:hypothetical protein CMV_000175 [Castanea mollissima]|uniref:Uncharacterized protein n=1 Tax=Castanea mollissima TaxID=60419 RepID=A0A8J4VXW3_9ROSI|nr:hypothetical protein CMV_000175 [Castanea mollissima]
MATSAFKSTTKRTSIGAATSSSTDDSAAASSNRSSSSASAAAHHRRSRSLSRFSRPSYSGRDAFDDGDVVAPAPRGKFVNTTRGSGFPEISLDDLAIEFFDSSGDRGRSSVKRISDGVTGDLKSSSSSSAASQRRGRSVSRHSARAASGGDGRGSVCNNSGGGRVVSESNPRRRRSVSVVRYQISDSESDLDHSQNSSNCANPKSVGSGNKQTRPAVSNQRQVLRRSFSQKDLKSHDGYSSQSSVLTDDEGRDGHSSRSGIEKTIQAVFAQKKAEHPSEDDVNGGLYAVMRNELRNAVEEIKMELEQAKVKTKTSDSASGDCMQSNNSDVLQAVSSIRRNYSTKLGQSEKRKQDLLAKLVLEEQRGRELSKIVKEMLPDTKKKELLPDPKKNAVEKPARARRRSNDRSRMSKRLTEEAEKYIEDFISNVEDTTDISSLDGERSDTSSSIGVIVKPETLYSPAVSNSLPVEMDGIVLPWLQWETSTEGTPQSCKSKAEPPTTPNTLRNAAQGVYTTQDQSNRSTSSRGSWSPGVIVNLSTNIEEDTGRKFGEPGNYHSQSCSGELRGGLWLDMDDYLKPQSTEEFIIERWKQKERISSGSLLLCNHMFF